MRQYGCLSAIPLSFFSRNLYRDVVRNWGFGVILYLLLLLTICWIFLSIAIQSVVTTSYVVFANKFIPQVPELTIKEGQLTTPENKPYLIKDPDEKDHDKAVFAIIDTSGKYTSLENQNATVLITKNAFYYRDDHEIKMQEFSKEFDLHVVPEKVQAAGHWLARWSWVLFFPLFLMLSFIYRIIEAAVYGLIGLIFSSIAEVTLTYGDTFKIAIFAMTPAIVLGTIFDWFSISFPYEWLFFLLVTLVYLVFGVTSLRSEAGKDSSK